MMGGQIGDQCAGCGKRRARLGHKNAPTAKPARDRYAIEARGAAARHEGRLGCIDALVDSDVHDGLNHMSKVVPPASPTISVCAASPAP